MMDLVVGFLVLLPLNIVATGWMNTLYERSILWACLKRKFDLVFQRPVILKTCGDCVHRKSVPNSTYRDAPDLVCTHPDVMERSLRNRTISPDREFLIDLSNPRTGGIPIWCPLREGAAEFRAHRKALKNMS